MHRWIGIMLAGALALALPVSCDDDTTAGGSSSSSSTGSGGGGSLPPLTPPYDCTPGEPSGTVYWISTDGSDDSGDGSESSPWATSFLIRDQVALWEAWIW